MLDVNLPVETVCYNVTEALGSGLEVREYTHNATAAVYNIGAAVTVYQEAQNIGAYCVLGYFVGYTNAKNESLVNARTVPLTLRTNTGAHPGWVGSMVVAPSLYPTRKDLPTPTYGVELAFVPDAGSRYIASLRKQFQESPQLEDFEAVCSQLEARLTKAGVKINKESATTPTHAYYWSRFWTGPWDFECWVAVYP